MKKKIIYPLIIMDFYPLRIDIGKDENAVYMCRNEKEVEKVITAYHKEMNDIVRNIQINPSKERITFQVATNYKGYTVEESDWYNKDISFEILKTFEE